MSMCPHAVGEAPRHVSSSPLSGPPCGTVPPACPVRLCLAGWLAGNDVAIACLAACDACVRLLCLPLPRRKAAVAVAPAPRCASLISLDWGAAFAACVCELPAAASLSLIMTNNA